MKSTIELTLCDSSNIAAYGYDMTSATLAVKFKSGPGGSIYHYEGVPAWVYTELHAAPSKGKYLAEKIRGAKTPDGEPLYPSTLMTPEAPDDDEDEAPVPQPTPNPNRDGQSPIGDPEKEAA